jgi:thioredoxin-related protein
MTEKEGYDKTFWLTGILLVCLVILAAVANNQFTLINTKLDAMEEQIVATQEHMLVMGNRTEYIYHIFYKNQLAWEQLDTGCGDMEAATGVGNDTLMMFSAPDCSYCIAQEQVLKKLSEDTGLKYLRICRADPSNAAAWRACEQAGYVINNSLSLAEKYQIEAIPTLIRNCNEKRVGTLAIEDPNLEYNDLRKYLVGETQ